MTRALGANTIAHRLIAIEQDEALRRRYAGPTKLRQAFHSELNASQRVACAAPEIMHDKLDRQARFPKHVLQQPSIGHFGFSLAADENRPAFGDRRASASHPIVGTPP